MIVRHNLFEVERIEQLPLVPATPPHHCSPRRFASARRNHCATDPSMSFATKSAKSGRTAPPIFASFQPILCVLLGDACAVRLGCCHVEVASGRIALALLCDSAAKEKKGGRHLRC